jgi:fructokinase
VRIISIGEVLWDVFDDGERLGGAPFNFAAHAARLGHTVAFVSAVGLDERGRLALQRAEELQLGTRFVTLDAERPTGVVSVRVDAAGQPRFVIHRPAAYDFPALSDQELYGLSSTEPDWIYFGTLQQMSQQARALTGRLIEANPGAQCFYDVNLREGSFEPALVEELMELATFCKLNEEEVRAVEWMLGWPAASLDDFSRQAAGRFGWDGVCVTRGAQGCAVLLGSVYLEAPGYPVTVADTVGAGDAFAAAFVHGLGSGWAIQEIADFANRVGALVASRAGAIPEWTPAEARALEPAIQGRIE